MASFLYCYPYIYCYFLKSYNVKESDKEETIYTKITLTKYFRFLGVPLLFPPIVDRFRLIKYDEKFGRTSYFFILYTNLGEKCIILYLKNTDIKKNEQYVTQKVSSISAVLEN